LVHIHMGRTCIAGFQEEGVEENAWNEDEESDRM
jgi:hypothetical protein